MEGSGIELAFEVGDVGAATVKDCFIPQNESATEETENEKEVGTAALIDFVQGDMYRLVLALLNTGFPKPWRTLKEDAQRELITAISEWEKEREKSYPPVVIEDAVPERDLEREGDQVRAARLPPIWRLEPSEPKLLRHWEQSKRKYFFGFIRVDESYNAAVSHPANELVRLFEIREKLSEHYGGDDEMRKRLRISTKDWTRFGTLTNDAPLKEGRHCGKHSNLRHATAVELDDARNIARGWIKAFADQL